MPTLCFFCFLFSFGAPFTEGLVSNNTVLKDTTGNSELSVQVFIYSRSINKSVAHCNWSRQWYWKNCEVHTELCESIMLFESERSMELDCI